MTHFEFGLLVHVFIENFLNSSGENEREKLPKPKPLTQWVAFCAPFWLDFSALFNILMNI